MSARTKIFNDNIHGSMRFHPCLVAVIDTKEFSRLRKISQLGNCEHVFPNCTHNRFEHSLGVAHLAGVFARHLQGEYPELVDDKDVLCVQMAGLCHDLGHGPYSHLWEMFLKEARPERKYRHEESSIAVFDHLLESNNLRPLLKDLADIDERDIEFVKEQIAGLSPADDGGASADRDWPYRGRGIEKSFLYEIVANKKSGIDVDKWDYFLRDDDRLKVGHVFDYDRFIQFSRVVSSPNGDGRRHIVIRDKERDNILAMVEDRARLHKRGYKHRVVKLIDLMMIDAWLTADRHSGGSLSKSCDDVAAHLKMTDASVNNRIVDSQDPELEYARELLDRIERRDFYHVVASINVGASGPEQVKGMKAKTILNEIEALRHPGSGLNEGDLTAYTKKITSGLETAKILVYGKDSPAGTEVKEISLADDLERIETEEVFIVVKKSEKLGEAMRLVQVWKEIHGI